MNASDAYGSNDQTDWGDVPEVPPTLKRAAAFVVPLAAPGFLDHFLEAFLAKAGRWLRLPWWLVHAALYLATALLVMRFGQFDRQLPRNGWIALWGMLAAEYVFTAWMLVHLRESRTLALLAVARLDSGPDRLTWMRRYLGPLHWGWAVAGSSLGGAGRSRFCLRLPMLTLLLMTIFYCHEVFGAMQHGSSGVLAVCCFYLPGVYTMTAKAAMLLAVLGHFWLLRGLVRLLRWDWANSLSDYARLRLWADTRRLAIRLNLIIGAATGVWMFAQGLALGITAWSWVLSVWLLGMFVAQGIILDAQRLRFAARSGWRAGPGSIMLMARQAPLLLGRAEVWAGAAIVAFPVAANCLGVALGKLSTR